MSPAKDSDRLAAMTERVPEDGRELRAAVGTVRERSEHARLFALSVSIGLGVVFQIPVLTFDPASVWPLLATLVATTAVSVPWLVAGARSGDRVAWAAGLLWPALAFASYAYRLLPGSEDAFFDPWGVNGILRLIGWTALVYAIVRHDLLGVQLPHIAVSRGALGASSLALLFIIAQIVENFLDARYSLLTGGIFAGAFLFSAQPLQRAIEGLGRRPSVPGAGRAPLAGDAGEERFRNAVRLAYRDRRFSPEEELMLADLAEGLGLGARRATEIRHEVERAEHRGRLGGPDGDTS